MIPPSIILYYYDSNGERIDLITKSEWKIRIDGETFTINKRVREFYLEVEAEGLSDSEACFDFYEFDMRCMSPSRLYGKNRTETVCFAEYPTAFNSGLQYKKNSTTVKNIYLVQPGDPLDSNFRIKLKNGQVMALAKFPQ